MFSDSLVKSSIEFVFNQPQPALYTIKDRKGTKTYFCKILL